MLELEFDRDHLAAAFAAVASVTPARHAQPVLQNVKLESGANGVSLLATDLEVELRVQVCGDARPAGEVLLPSVRFGSILREAPAGTVSLCADGGALVVSAGRSEYRLPLQSADEFPVLRAFEASDVFTLPAEDLRLLLSRTVFATDVASTRYALGGVHLEFGADSALAVGTDGRRMAVARGVAGVSGKPQQATALVPTKAVKALERVLPRGGQAEVKIAGSSIAVQCDNVTLTARLVDGRFPQWRDVLPKSPCESVVLLSGPFTAALRQAAITTTDESKGVDLSFSPGIARLGCEAASAGKSLVELPVPYGGPEQSLTLDPRYVLEFFKAAPHEPNCTLELRGPESAAVFRVPGYEYVVMPLARS